MGWHAHQDLKLRLPDRLPGSGTVSTSHGLKKYYGSELTGPAGTHIPLRLHHQSQQLFQLENFDIFVDFGILPHFFRWFKAHVKKYLAPVRPPLSRVQLADQTETALHVQKL